jgi:hypothetical protein
VKNGAIYIRKICNNSFSPPEVNVFTKSIAYQNLHLQDLQKVIGFVPSPPVVA